MSDLGEIEIRVVRFEDVKPMLDNPRVIDEKSFRGLKASIDRFGYVEPIIWNEDTGNIVGGHQRFRVLQEMGATEAKMVIVNVAKAEEMSLNLTLNNPEIEGEYTSETKELLKKVKDADASLFNSLNFDGLVSRLEEKDRVIVDKVFSNAEINVDSLIIGSDETCPCCGFQWKVDGKDLVELVNENE